MAKIQAAIHPDDALHYNKFGLTRNKVEIWEDGMRTDGSKGSATIVKIENGAVTESVKEKSDVWELMYFGKAGADKK